MSLSIKKQKVKGDWFSGDVIKKTYIFTGEVILIEHYPETDRNYGATKLTLKAENCFQLVTFRDWKLSEKQAALFYKKNVEITFNQTEYDYFDHRGIDCIKISKIAN